MQVVRHHSALGSWEQARAPAHPALAGTVRRYVGWSERTPVPLRRRELPSDTVTLILGWDHPVRVTLGNGRTSGALAFLAPLHAGPALTEHDGRSAGVQVDLSPLAARQLVGVPMAGLAHDVIGLDAIFGNEGRELVERLQAAPGWAERFAVVDRFMLRRLGDAPPPPPDALRAWRDLRASHGTLRVEALARRIGCSRRHLAVRFGDWVGLPPKAAARVLRFQRAVDLLAGDDGSRLGEIAASCGFSDQPHLNRDFRDLAGVSPGELIGSRLPDNGGYVVS